ncbi:meiotic recombination protein REC8 homolog isoform X2 [Betta splendens]|uniref:Meiotic recombination protein REC8 homolog isoform X2 n=1 Tax=Betta splendens TaxID=158456 RepID=A0A9W2XBQ7_BETSP|nr:meiotic recombination protein REC8 homolog isoform X2 [Betta splendens]
MFYYPAVLRRHSGCFSTIWLVATKGIRVSRRDILKVNVKRTCDDIMDYLLEKVPAPRPGLPRPRFSLYLSSQLQYGVVVVFHRQCAMLLEEIHSILVQLLKQRASQKIDMDDYTRPSLVFSDALSLLQETDGASDPMFGLMHMHIMPSPTRLIEMSGEFLRRASSESPEPTSPASAPEPEPEPDGITASPETITLRETEPVAIPAAEFEGEDLEHDQPDVIDFLLAGTELFPEDVEVLAGEGESERGASEGEKDRPAELTGSPITLQPTILPSEDATLLPQEEPALLEKPETPPDELTPVSVPALPSPPPAARTPQRPRLQSEDVSPPPKKKKRQLIFFDPETQIPQEVLQRQIDNTLTETRQVPPLPPPSDRVVSAADLFSNPCTQVQFLWRQAATITPRPGVDLRVGERGPESTESEEDKEQEMVEAGEERQEQKLELSPQEVPRDLPESEVLDISGAGTLPLEASEQRETSREMSPMLASDREGSIVSRSVSTLQDVPEVLDEGLERIPEHPGLLPELDKGEEAPVLFRSLLPPGADRKTVSIAFKRLLEALSSRRVRAEQRQPYGDILISPAPH